MELLTKVHMQLVSWTAPIPSDVGFRLFQICGHSRSGLASDADSSSVDALVLTSVTPARSCRSGSLHDTPESISKD